MNEWLSKMKIRGMWKKGSCGEDHETQKSCAQVIHNGQHFRGCNVISYKGDVKKKILNSRNFFKGLYFQQIKETVLEK